MAESIKRVISAYKNVTFSVFTPAGLVTSAVIILIFVVLNLIEFTLIVPFTSLPIQLAFPNPVFIVMAIIVAIYTTSLWYIIGTRWAPRVGTLLTEKKILNIIFTKGDIHYFEKTTEEELKILPSHIISKFINLLLSWLAVSAFVIGVLLPLGDIIIVAFGNPIGAFGNPNQDRMLRFFNPDFGTFPIMYIYKLILIFVISPLLLSIVWPIPWMLIDTKLKSYKSGLKLNFLVGKQLQSRLSAFFAVGGLVTLFITFATDIPAFINFIIAFLGFVLFFLGLPSAIIVLLYNLLFQVQYYESILTAIPVPFGSTKVEMEVKIKKKPEIEGKNEENDIIESLASEEEK